jgi:PPK2 family polyphosphate:nucleotide phosphotransferase
VAARRRRARARPPRGDTLPRMAKLDIDDFAVKPGSRVRLEKWDPDADGGLDKAQGEAALEKNLAELVEAQMRFWANRSRGMLVVLQGIDTAGKDGVIRKVMTALNPQGVVVRSFKKPGEHEAAHDYLWRIHMVCPAKGEIAIFNRSHYEDVIVPTVHGGMKEKEIERRYRQINDFERMLTEEGTVILKFFLTISKQEQLDRLHARLEDPAKQWKFSINDVRERGFWDRYMEAFEAMLSNTSTEHAPWCIVPSNRKWFRNLLVSEALRRAFRDLKLEWPQPAEDLSNIKLV